MTLLDIVEAYFRQCAEKFVDDPSADNWTRLRVAMWALQGVRNQTLVEREAALHAYIRHLAIMHKGDDQLGEPE